MPSSTRKENIRVERKTSALGTQSILYKPAYSS